MGTPDALQRLIDIEEIKQLKAMYFRLMDTKQFDDMYALFVDDVVIEGMREPAFEGELEEYLTPDQVSGSSAFIEGLKAEIGLETAHHGHMSEITITSPDAARGVWAMFDYLRWPEKWREDRELPARQYGIKGYGHYHEQYQKTSGSWKISRMKLTRLRVDRLFKSDNNA